MKKFTLKNIIKNIEFLKGNKVEGTKGESLGYNLDLIFN